MRYTWVVSLTIGSDGKLRGEREIVLPFSPAPGVIVYDFTRPEAPIVVTDVAWIDDEKRFYVTASPDRGQHLPDAERVASELVGYYDANWSWEDNDAPSPRRRPAIDHDMTIIPPQPTPNGTGTGVRLLDEEDRALLQRDLDAGRIVAIYDQAAGMNLTYVRCTNAAAIREVFIAYAGDFDIRE
jgi:hypothetical protein